MIQIIYYKFLLINRQLYLRNSPIFSSFQIVISAFTYSFISVSCSVKSVNFVHFNHIHFDTLFHWSIAWQFCSYLKMHQDNSVFSKNQFLTLLSLINNRGHPRSIINCKNYFNRPFHSRNRFWEYLKCYT